MTIYFFLFKFEEEFSKLFSGRQVISSRLLTIFWENTHFSSASFLGFAFKTCALRWHKSKYSSRFETGNLAEDFFFQKVCDCQAMCDTTAPCWNINSTIVEFVFLNQISWNNFHVIKRNGRPSKEMNDFQYKSSLVILAYTQMVNMTEPCCVCIHFSE